MGEGEEKVKESESTRQLARDREAEGRDREGGGRASEGPVLRKGRESELTSKALFKALFRLYSGSIKASLRL